MTIRVSIPQKHNIARKTYNKQAGAPAPASLTISLFHSTPPQALPPGSPAPSHPHTSHTTHHSVPQPSHGSPAPYRSPPSTYPLATIASLTYLSPTVFNGVRPQCGQLKQFIKILHLFS